MIGNIKVLLSIVILNSILYNQIKYELEIGKNNKSEMEPVVAINPNDYLFLDDYHWNLYNIGNLAGTEDADIDATDAWDISTGSESIIVAIIDSGVDYFHEDLINNIWQNLGEDFDGDENRDGYPSGLYFVKMLAHHPETNNMGGQAKDYTKTQKVMLLK